MAVPPLVCAPVVQDDAQPEDACCAPLLVQLPGEAARELCAVCNLFGYGEIKPMGSHYYESSMLERFRRLEDENFQSVLIERREDIWPSFKAFLSRDLATAEG